MVEASHLFQQIAWLSSNFVPCNTSTCDALIPLKKKKKTAVNLAWDHLEIYYKEKSTQSKSSCYL